MSIDTTNQESYAGLLELHIGQAINGDISPETLHSILLNIEPVALGQRYELKLGNQTGEKLVFCAGAWAVASIFGSEIYNKTKVSILTETETGPSEITISPFENSNFSILPFSQ